MRSNVDCSIVDFNGRTVRMAAGRGAVCGTACAVSIKVGGKHLLFVFASYLIVGCVDAYSTLGTWFR